MNTWLISSWEGPDSIFLSLRMQDITMKYEKNELYNEIGKREEYFTFIF